MLFIAPRTGLALAKVNATKVARSVVRTKVDMVRANVERQRDRDEALVAVVYM